MISVFRLDDHNNTRTTRQKRTILEIIQGTDTHPTADWIYDEAVRRDIKISKSTIYRNLSILVQEGKILRLDVINAASHYDGNIEKHAHLACTRCGKLVDLMGVNMDIDESRLSKGTGYIISSASLIIYGICPDCQRSM